MKNVSFKITGDLWEATDESLGATGELKNLVTVPGQTLSSLDLKQAIKSIMRIAGGTANSMYYAAGGTTPNITLSRPSFLSGIQAFTGYEDGVVVKFALPFAFVELAGYTIDLQGLGAIPIKNSIDFALDSGELVEMVYYNSEFIITSKQVLKISPVESQVKKFVENMGLIYSDSEDILTLALGKLSQGITRPQELTAISIISEVLLLERPAGSLYPVIVTADIVDGFTIQFDTTSLEGDTKLMTWTQIEIDGVNYETDLFDILHTAGYKINYNTNGSPANMIEVSPLFHARYSASRNIFLFFNIFNHPYAD